MVNTAWSSKKVELSTLQKRHTKRATGWLQTLCALTTTSKASQNWQSSCNRSEMLSSTSWGEINETMPHAWSKMEKKYTREIHSELLSKTTSLSCLWSRRLDRHLSISMRILKRRQNSPIGQVISNWATLLKAWYTPFGRSHFSESQMLFTIFSWLVCALSYCLSRVYSSTVA